MHHVWLHPFYEFLLSKYFFQHFQIGVFIWKHARYSQNFANKGKHQHFGKYFFYIFLKVDFLNVIYTGFTSFLLTLKGLLFVKLIILVFFQLDGIQKNLIVTKLTKFEDSSSVI